MNKVTVLLFATLRERCGMKQVELDWSPGTTIATLKEQLVERYPGLSSSMKTVLVAVDHEFSEDNKPVACNAEVAMFPPVSGG